MSEHIVTGTTVEEREKELFSYIVKCGWDESRAWAYAILLGNDWMPELEQNYIEWFNHKPLTDIQVGEITLNSLFNFWHREDLTTAVRLLWEYKQDNFENPGLTYLCGLHDEVL